MMGERLVTHRSFIFVVFILPVLLFSVTVVPFNISVVNEAEQFLNPVHSPTEVGADSEIGLTDAVENNVRKDYNNPKDTRSQGTNEERVRRKREPISTTIGIVSGLMGAFDFIRNILPETPETPSVVLPKLQEMQGRLLAVDFELKELKNHVSILHMKTQLYESDRTIRDSLNFAVAAAATKSNESTTKFIKKAEGLESAINAFVDGMLGNGLIGSDILDNLRNAKDNHARNFLSAAHAFRNLTGIANTVLAAYYNMKKTDQAHVDHWRENILEKEELINERISQIEIECRKEGNAKKYVERILTIFHNETTGQVAQRLYNELSDRYDTSLWLVVVYGINLDNTHVHAFNNLTRRMHYVLDVEGKNAVAYAFSHSDVAANQNLCRLKVAAYENRVNWLKDRHSFVYCDNQLGVFHNCLNYVILNLRQYRVSYVVEVLLKHYDSELSIKDDDAVVVGGVLGDEEAQKNVFEIRHSPSICFYSSVYKDPSRSRISVSIFIHFLIVPGAKPPLLPGWDDSDLRGISSIKKFYTRYGAYCKGPCSIEERYQYFWCYQRNDYYNLYSWDYCSPRMDVTI